MNKIRKAFLERVKQIVKLKSDENCKQVEAHEIFTWFKGDMRRAEAEDALKGKLVGSFIIRRSETIDRNLVLTVKVPLYANSNLVSHYLVTYKNKKYSLKGMKSEFTSLIELVSYYAKNRETLPVLLDLTSSSEISN